MKRFILLLTGLVWLTQTLIPAHAQDAATAAAIAERRDAAERYNRLSSQVDDLLAANTALQKRLAALEQELSSVRAEAARASANNPQYVTKDELKQVVETIRKLDQDRQADNQKIIEEFKKVVKSSLAMPPPSAAPTTRISTPANVPPPADEASTGPRVGWEHAVQKGEFLMTIINAYNKKLKEEGIKGKITLDAVLKANAGLDPNRMIVGQKIFLPKPGE